MRPNADREPIRENGPGKRFPWPFHVGLVAFGVAIGFLDGWVHPWGLTIGASAIAVLIPVFYYRQFWANRWFWFTVSALAILQIPLVIVAGPLIDQFRFLFLLFFAATDGVMVSMVVRWVSPRSQDNGNC
jgi:hypothetical protein